MRGPETEKCHKRRLETGFYDRYMRGEGVDIGFRGEIKDAEPVLPTAIGIEGDTPGYDGRNLPFETESKDYVYSSHCLEHVQEPLFFIKEWFRVLKVGGHLVLVLPHQYLYEKKKDRPSRYNGGHYRFYTPSKLLQEIEEALTPNTYRVRWCCDNDEGFDYSISPEKHSVGEYQIELVLQKIQKPSWDII